VHRWLEAFQTLLLLVTARVAVAVVPFRWIAARLGEPGRESPAALAPGDTARARAVGARIRGVCRRIGWRPSCLVQSTAAMVLLRRRGLEGTVYLGVAGDEREGLRAHAWVRCGEIYVTGGRERHAFSVISTFARA
jgi:hypothetical protein